MSSIDSLAQQVEHIPFKDGVLGSNPRWITSQKSAVLQRFFGGVYRTRTGHLDTASVAL